MSCNSSHVCVAATSQDDPTGRCAGTCDASGACKSKQGQVCNTVTGGCIGGTTCSQDGYCCNTACTGPCVACDYPGQQGTCKSLAQNEAPHIGHGNCNGVGTTCAGSCNGSGACGYGTGACGSGPACSGTSLVGQSACSAGTCVAPTPQNCPGSFVCSSTACKTGCTADADCLSGYFCAASSCHRAAISIAAGEFVACVVLGDGSARCWGNNSSGELGTGTATTTAPGGISTPVTVSGLGGPISAMGSGDDFSCALLQNGSIWCWGFDGNGQLGGGTTSGTPILTPVEVVGLNSVAKTIAVGQSHTCAWLRDGSVQCWGLNGYGQLGNGTFTQSPTPVTVGSLIGTVLGISATADTSYALLTSVGQSTIESWGMNNYGQLGDDAITSASPYGSSTPVDAIGVSPLALAVSDFGFNECALLSNGSIDCWGQGLTSMPTAVTGLSGTAVQVAVGGQICAVMSGSTGAVECWTAGGSPAVVTGLSGPAVEVASGESFSCALLKNGSVMCWGDNTYGQLGSGSFLSSAIPVAVAGW
jgi:Regulator of chromosome condensation (RCC1) repeat